MIKWSEDCGVYTDELTKFFNSVDTSGDIMGQYKAHLVKLQKEQSTFTSFTKKASTALKSLGAAMASMAISWAIGKIIYIAVTAWDNFNVTVKEVQENVDELTSNIQSLNAELDELKGKDSLTDAEQNRLKYLETRVDLEERLLKIEQTRLAQEQLGKSSKITDWFDDDSYVKKATKEFGVYALDANYFTNPGFNPLPFAFINGFNAYYNGAEAVIREGNEQYEELNEKYENLIIHLRTQFFIILFC